ncbi:UNVERIFIED_CONTAM: glycosyl transferase, partial [Euhalothece sp. KZN 001]
MEDKIGVVVIGRNEGERLIRCFQSLQKSVSAIVYVDSGSTDGSVEEARKRNIEVVVLDTSIPFTAARARNTGFDALLDRFPHLDFVQFVDGDCEVVSGWLEAASNYLVNHSQIAVVCGRRRERFPEKSIYNRLCDLEWDTPVGEAKACGGDAMMRVVAFQEVKGFNSNLIAGEEPELCYRLRQQGWKIWRLDAEMTRHDAEMTKFSQWWKRNVRAGYAYAGGSWLHGHEAERYKVKETKSNWLWGTIIPVLLIGNLWWTRGFSLILLIVYPVLAYKIFRYQQQVYLFRNAVLFA